MPVNIPSNYGTLPTSTSTSTSTSASARKSPRPTLQSRARTHVSRIRPWRELFLDLPSFSLPYSYYEAMSRVRCNISYFRMNYALVMLFILFCSLIYHPVSMITFLVVFAAWYFLCFSRDQPVVIYGRFVDDRILMVFISLVTIVALVLTQVGVNVLVSLVIGVVIVGIHSGLREIEDLFLDDLDSAEGGLLSVVSAEQGEH